MKKVYCILIILFLTGCSPSAEVIQKAIYKTQTLESKKMEEIAQINASMSSRIVFSSDRDGNTELYVMDEDGQNQIRLTNSPFFDGGPAWSSDGQNIVFFSDRDGNAEIYSMDVNGNDQTNLSNNPYDDTYPDWSPDKQKIVFESIRDGDLEIYVMNSDGSDQMRLTNSPGDDYGAKWSPDGKQIAFTSVRDGNPEIYLMKPDGSNQIDITNNPANDVLPSWSGNGRKISFDSDRDGYYEIYTMDINGSNPIRLTYSNGNWGYSDWSPDGQKICFVENSGTDWDIYVMNADGSNLIEILSGQASDFAPQWSPGTTSQSIPTNPTRISVMMPSPTTKIIPQEIDTTPPFIDEVGWIELYNTGTVSLGQETPTTLNQLVIFHGTNASGSGFGCKGCYALEPVIGIELNIPLQDINGSDIVFRQGEEYQYLIKGRFTGKTVDDFFMGSLPVVEVTYLERLK